MWFGSGQTVQKPKKNEAKNSLNLKRRMKNAGGGNCEIAS